MFDWLKTQSKPEEEKSFYVEFSWLPGKIIITKGTDSIHALGRLGLTMWDDDGWKELVESISKYYPESEREYVDLRPIIGVTGLVDYFPQLDSKLREPYKPEVKA